MLVLAGENFAFICLFNFIMCEGPEHKQEVQKLKNYIKFQIIQQV